MKCDCSLRIECMLTPPTVACPIPIIADLILNAWAGVDVSNEEWNDPEVNATAKSFKTLIQVGEARLRDFIIKGLMQGGLL